MQQQGSSKPAPRRGQRKKQRAEAAATPAPADPDSSLLPDQPDMAEQQPQQPPSSSLAAADSDEQASEEASEQLAPVSHLLLPVSSLKQQQQHCWMCTIIATCSIVCFNWVWSQLGEGVEGIHETVTRTGRRYLTTIRLPIGRRVRTFHTRQEAIDMLQLAKDDSAAAEVPLLAFADGKACWASAVMPPAADLHACISRHCSTLAHSVKPERGLACTDSICSHRIWACCCIFACVGGLLTAMLCEQGPCMHTPACIRLYPCVREPSPVPSPGSMLTAAVLTACTLLARPCLKFHHLYAG